MLDFVNSAEDIKASIASFYEETVFRDRQICRFILSEGRLIFDPKSGVVEEATPETYVEDIYVK